MASIKRPFKVMAPKELAQVVEVIREMYCVEAGGPAGGRVNSTRITAEMMSKPSAEDADMMLRYVCQWVYDVDFPKKKQQIQHFPIHEEALDVSLTFTLTRQLAQISGIEDFVWRDIWEPNPKRFRLVLSGLVNFCRYKEKKMKFLEPLEQEFQQLDSERLELIKKVDEIIAECIRQEQEQYRMAPELRSAEKACEDAQDRLETVEQEREALDKVVNDKQARLTTKQSKEKKLQQKIAELLEKKSSLEDQIADCPNAIQDENTELDLENREKKAFVEEKNRERRSRTQRDQALDRVERSLKYYLDVLVKCVDVQEQLEGKAAERKDKRKEKEESNQVRVALEQECGDLEASLEKVGEEIERSKAEFVENEQSHEHRRNQAIARQQELQEKQSEEQRDIFKQQDLNLQLEAQVSTTQKDHDLQVADLWAQIDGVKAEHDAYSQTVDSMLRQFEADRPVHLPIDKALSMKSPRRSPSPGRALRSPYGRPKSPCDRPMQPRQLRLMQSPEA